MKAATTPDSRQPSITLSDAAIISPSSGKSAARSKIDGDEAKEQIKALIPLEDFIGETVDLKPAGRGKFKGLCPFHNEKSPSFHVDTDKGLFYCHGCKVGGDLFTFVQKTRALEFYDALTLLAERTGVTLPERSEHKRTRSLADLQVLEQGMPYEPERMGVIFRDLIMEPTERVALKSRTES